MTDVFTQLNSTTGGRVQRLSDLREHARRPVMCSVAAGGGAATRLGMALGVALAVAPAAIRYNVNVRAKRRFYSATYRVVGAAARVRRGEQRIAPLAALPTHRPHPDTVHETLPRAPGLPRARLVVDLERGRC